MRAGLISMLTDCGGAGSGTARADILLASLRRSRSALSRALCHARPRLVVACGEDAVWRDGPRETVHGAGVRRFASAIRAARVGARLFVPEILRENDLRGLL